MPTRLRNVSSAHFTMPAPYKGILPPGGGGIVAADKPTILAALGGSQVTGIIQLSPGLASDVVTLPTTTTADNPGALTDVTALQIKTKYMNAVVSTVHMKADTGFAGLSALAGGATQAQCNAQANAIQTALAAHMNSVGTILADGCCLAADPTHRATLIAIPVASSLPTCITLISGILAAIVGHGNAAGVHFHNDTGTSGSGATMAPNPAVTLADCVTDLNSLLVNLQTHVALASQ